VLIGAMPEERDLGGIVSIPLTENQRELAEWYSAADVFLTLSREESFGKVSAEALSCGTPVIAVGTTANPELVGRGCGVVISDTSPGAVLDAIARVRSVGKDKMLPTCREFALKSFGMEDRISDTLAVYNELIKE
ncbi:MAG: glycosyltransferase, partial [Clostridia bacterium]|nr:glycosyltransferase [Clostridia bacterium]